MNITLSEALVLHEQAVAAYRVANENCALTALVILASGARATWPTAQTIEVDWSDQGDYLYVHAVRLADGVEADDDDEEWSDFTDAYGDYAGSLAGNNDDTWGPFCVEGMTRTILLDIDKILAGAPDADHGPALDSDLIADVLVLDEDEASEWGRCDSCGAPCDNLGCTVERGHEVALP